MTVAPNGVPSWAVPYHQGTPAATYRVQHHHGTAVVNVSGFDGVPYHEQMKKCGAPRSRGDAVCQALIPEHEDACSYHKGSKALSEG